MLYIYIFPFFNVLFGYVEIMYYLCNWFERLFIDNTNLKLNLNDTRYFSNR